ncbi:PREDICTED: tumor necrosis factor ligand superfamily member 9 [Chrysochloris asiatica]|uniref:Tumor necrosis factor ligand superfamily member 9 n=1 Tax=Chrysochloris asiatica TaxID=185453 RepID=A0A9B0TYM3_CHRAS|nr:PREDICTED: tumor necrosis factor ligand superfamily member 9 [Chrysochloris asiatica]
MGCARVKGTGLESPEATRSRRRKLLGKLESSKSDSARKGRARRGASPSQSATESQTPTGSFPPLAMRALTTVVRDPETLSPAPSARTCRPLDWVLGAALLLVAAACAACAVISWVVPDAPRPAPSSHPSPGNLFQVHGRDPQQGGFAQLVSSDVQLTNGTLKWYIDQGVAGVVLAQDLQYNTKKQELMVTQGGVYYVFLHLEMERVVVGLGSGSGLVSVALHQHPGGSEALSLRVTLPAASSLDSKEVDSEVDSEVDHAVGFRGCLLRLRPRQRLSVHMRISGEAHSAWQLTQGATVLGLFRVSPEDPTSPRPT